MYTYSHPPLDSSPSPLLAQLASSTTRTTHPRPAGARVSAYVLGVHMDSQFLQWSRRPKLSPMSLRPFGSSHLAFSSSWALTHKRQICSWLVMVDLRKRMHSAPTSHDEVAAGNLSRRAVGCGHLLWYGSLFGKVKLCDLLTNNQEVKTEDAMAS